MAQSLVIIPTYNEKENIEAILKAVMLQPSLFDVLVVDDNSPDGTAELVLKTAKEYPNRIHLEVRTKKSGLGTAYIHGFHWALERHYEYIFEMDADFSHKPDDLELLLEACKNKGADVAIGSRYVKGITVVNWPLNRILLSYGASKYVKLITGMSVNDSTAGFICYQRKVLESIDLSKIHFVGYAFQIEMKFKAYLKKFTIIEIPVIFTDRVKGISKMTGSIIYEAVFGVISMKIKSLFQK
ncbi:polyprenol monophosphomannose synthase [Neptunitalea lumnitzerae]|uniref:Dolichyl-phosphate beta-D-mannosyltransferase n=1 Tax=Neptunitalea lumnitzerae TaxID=2965509 RepID=A0ABQ5MGJ1_9FLAO|nr:polyprenol monophosphomannose synthase [Neptunitalea sp. Y10]GLB48497.1 dolichyl-phosphate beta-D-mannosyltransferase [Neptunitalea sp. Y10]